jgi:transglutaminase-like putative cysteine protease
MTEIADYLEVNEIIDWHHPAVRAQAKVLAQEGDPVQEVARRCFEWVRDEIRHSVDFRLNPVTCTASDVLRHRTGFCYAKTHLLAALLRANGIPAGFGYQRLSIDGSGPPFCLHGFNALHLEGVGWYRVDARGNRPGIETRFTPPREVLAFEPRLEGERTWAEIYPTPLPVVVEALQRCQTYDELMAVLPDFVMV